MAHLQEVSLATMRRALRARAARARGSLQRYKNVGSGGAVHGLFSRAGVRERLGRMRTKAAVGKEYKSNVARAKKTLARMQQKSRRARTGTALMPVRQPKFHQRADVRRYAKKGASALGLGALGVGAYKALRRGKKPLSMLGRAGNFARRNKKALALGAAGVGGMMLMRRKRK